MDFSPSPASCRCRHDHTQGQIPGTHANSGGQIPEGTHNLIQWTFGFRIAFLWLQRASH